MWLVLLHVTIQPIFVYQNIYPPGYFQYSDAQSYHIPYTTWIFLWNDYMTNSCDVIITEICQQHLSFQYKTRRKLRKFIKWHLFPYLGVWRALRVFSLLQHVIDNSHLTFVFHFINMFLEHYFWSIAVRTLPVPSRTVFCLQPPDFWRKL